MVRITTSKSGISGLLRNQWGNPGFSYHDFCCVYLGRLRIMCVYTCVINVYTMYKYVKKMYRVCACHIAPYIYIYICIYIYILSSGDVCTTVSLKCCLDIGSICWYAGCSHI